VVFLTAESFWYDELLSVLVARLDWSALGTFLMHYESNMALYYGLLKTWLGFGEGEATVRLLSVIAGVATVPAVFAVGTRLFGARVGLTAALLLSLHAFHVRYSQEARSYALVVLLTVLSSYLFLISTQARSRWIRAGYIVVSTLAVYAHYFALWVLLAHWLSVLAVRGPLVPRRWVIVSAVVILLLISPLGIFVEHAGIRQTGYLPLPWLQDMRGTLHVLVGTGRPMAAGYWPLSSYESGWPDRSLVAAYVMLCLLGLLAIVTLLRSSWGSWRAGHGILLVLWLGIPPAAGLVLSTVVPLLIPRFLSVCVPPMVILAAAGVFSMSRPAIRAVALIVVTALAIRGVAIQHRYTENEDWRGSTNFILAQARQTDGLIYFAPWYALFFDYYADQQRSTERRPVVAYPPRPFAWSGRFAELGWGPPQPAPLEPGGAVLETVSARYERLWVVLSPRRSSSVAAEQAQAIQTYLAGRYRSVQKMEFNRVVVLLYAKDFMD
jgi:uncharacterized membrane protein